jgi:hypothetical protein
MVAGRHCGDPRSREFRWENLTKPEKHHPQMPANSGEMDFFPFSRTFAASRRQKATVHAIPENRPELNLPGYPPYTTR